MIDRAKLEVLLIALTANQFELERMKLVMKETRATSESKPTTGANRVQP